MQIKTFELNPGINGLALAGIFTSFGKVDAPAADRNV